MICLDEEEEATQLEHTKQLEQINQKKRSKKGRLKRYRDGTKQYKQNRTFQTNEISFYQRVGGESAKISMQRHIKEAKYFFSKYGKRGFKMDKQHKKIPKDNQKSI